MRYVHPQLALLATFKTHTILMFSDIWNLASCTKQRRLCKLCEGSLRCCCICCYGRRLWLLFGLLVWQFSFTPFPLATVSLCVLVCFHCFADVLFSHSRVIVVHSCHMISHDTCLGVVSQHHHSPCHIPAH